jgi:hypothetical protein
VRIDPVFGQGREDRLFDHQRSGRGGRHQAGVPRAAPGCREPVRSWRSAARNKPAVTTWASAATPSSAAIVYPRPSRRDAVRPLFHRGKRAVPLRYMELDPAGAFDPRTAYLGTMVLEALGHHDPDTVRCAGYRITDRLVFGLEYSRDRYLGPAARQIEIEPDRRKHRFEHLCHDQTENVEYRAFG